MSTIRITHIDHCSVLVTHVGQARSFYSGVLGLREIPAPKEFDFVSLWYDLGGGQTLHLLLSERPDSISPRHFCLRVEDAAAARRELNVKGIAIEDTVKIEAAERFFIRDPDGNRIEILQWLRPYRAESDGRFRA